MSVKLYRQPPRLRLYHRLGRSHERGSFLEVELLFDVRDLWVGVHWRRFAQAIEFFVCPLPAVQVHVYFQWGM
jgi:hypothetical protein